MSTNNMCMCVYMIMERPNSTVVATSLDLYIRLLTPVRGSLKVDNIK